MVNMNKWSKLPRKKINESTIMGNVKNNQPGNINREDEQYNDQTVKAAVKGTEVNNLTCKMSCW